MAESQTMKIIIQARDEARATLDRLNKALKGLGETTKKADTRFGIFKKTVKSFGASIRSLKSRIFSLKGVILGAVAAFGAWKIYSFVKSTTLLAARFKTLGVTLETLGRKAGYNADQIAEFEKGLHKTGIAALETRTILAKMIQSQLDLTKSTQLARVAQNAAVIAGLNSSETFQRMIHAIQANSVEILRTIGMNVSFEKSYKKFARTLDIAVGQMTEAQKTQARYNAVLEGGVQIMGAYESAMTTAGKKMLSFSRYVSNFKLEFGKAFEPALAGIVDAATAAMKEFTKTIKDPDFQKKLGDFADIVATQVKDAFKWLIDNKEVILDTIAGIASLAGLGIKALTKVLSVFAVSKDEAIRQVKEALDLHLKILDGYEKKRAAIVKKLKLGSKSFGVFEDYDDIGKELAMYEKLIKEKTATVEKLGAKFNKLSETDEEKKKKKVYFRSYQALQFKDYLKPEKVPLGSTVLESTLKRTKQQVKLEFTKIESLFDENLITTKEYYEEQRKLAEENFKVEEEFLVQKAIKEPDKDKQLKVEDQLYALRKNFAIKTIKLNDDEEKAFKDLADGKLEIEKGFLAARLSLAKGDNNYGEVNKLELEQLKVTQKEKIKELIKNKASSNQIEQQKVINDKQTQQLLVDQAERSSDRRLEIEQKLFDQRLDIAKRSTGSSTASVNKLELEQLKITQAEEVKVLEDANANRNQLKEQGVLHTRQQQLLEEEHTKTSTDKKLSIEQMFQQARLALIDPDNMQAVFDAEMQSLELFQSDRLQSIKDAKLSEVDELAAIAEAGRLDELEKDQLHAEQRLKIHDAYVNSAKEILGGLNTTFGDLYEASGRDIKAFFQIQKGVSIAQATIATYEAATKAYSSMAGIPYIGPALGAAAAAVAVAAGLAKVAVIKSQSYAEGGVVKGRSPSPKADNIQANVTAGEYIHPVDVVKHYGVKAMELIRKKLIPPELIYQASTFKEKKETVKQSFEKNLEKTSNFIKDYSKKLLSIGKAKDSIGTTSKTISTAVIDRSTRVHREVIDKSVSDKNEVSVVRLFEKFISEKSSRVKSKVKSKRQIRTDRAKELIKDVRRDKETISRDRTFVGEYRQSEYRSTYQKDQRSARDSERTYKRDRSSYGHEVDKSTLSRNDSKIFVGTSVESRGTFLNSIVKETLDRQKAESVVRELLQSITIDRVIDKAITDKIVTDKSVDKSSVTRSALDRIVEILATDKTSIAKIVDASKFKEVIDRSRTDKFQASHVDSAIEKAVRDRIVERSMTKSVATEKSGKTVSDKLSDRVHEFVKVIKNDVSVNKVVDSIRDIVTPIKQVVSTVSEKKMVAVPVIIKEAGHKVISTVGKYSDSSTSSKFIKLVRSRTSEAIQQLAGGGSVRGASPHSKADNITIKATAGEFMHPVDVVKHYTTKGMEAIRQKIVPREVIAQYANNITMPQANHSHAFALGGEIPKTRETSGSAAKEAEQKQVSIVNLIDPAVFQQYLASDDGQNQLKNVITANKFEYKQILG